MPLLPLPENYRLLERHERISLRMVLQADVVASAARALAPQITLDELHRLQGRLSLARDLVETLQLGDPIVIDVGTDTLDYTVVGGKPRLRNLEGGY